MISLKAMSVGDGYKYLTKHVARGDVDQAAREGGATPLTNYYTASGYPPGRWVGSGLAGLGEDLESGTPVEEWRMAALFAEGRDPMTGKLLGRQPRAFASLTDRVATKTAALPDTLDARGRQTAIDEIRRVEARRVNRSAKGGFDLTFTVPKSVSALWAVADPSTQDVILTAHHETMSDMIDYLEREVVFTRLGRNGVAQVDTRGIIAAAFDHWDSRGGDPNLHTHLAVANRVQTTDGTWLTIDSRGLHHAIVAVSELYDATLADRLTRDLGVDWDARERATRRFVAHEIAGIPEELIVEFSARTREIAGHLDTLTDKFVARNGSQPTPAEVSHLRQQATLTQRPAKHSPAKVGDLTGEWRDRAEQVTGTQASVIVESTVERFQGRLLHADEVDEDAIGAWAVLAVGAVEARRSTWNRWNLLTEAARLTQGQLRFATPGDRERFTRRIVDAAQEVSIGLHPDRARPAAKRWQRIDGEDVFTQHAGRRYTSAAILGAESYLTVRSSDTTGPTATGVDLSTAGLADDQAAAIDRIATSGRCLEVLIGPAGTGKTTTLAALRTCWEAEHGVGSILGLAPSASAAEVLATALGIDTENTAKWLHETTGSGAKNRHDTQHRLATALTRARTPAARERLKAAHTKVAADVHRWQFLPGQLVIIDEASLVGTLSLAALAHQAEVAGAKVLMVGDQAQLTAVDAGGALGMLAASPDAVELSSVWRFSAAWERTASLRLRDGDERAIGIYQGQDRISEGLHADMLDDAYKHWLADTRTGQTSLLIAGDNATVRDLNVRARADLCAIGAVEADGARLSDGTSAGIGDRIVTRRNNRGLSDRNGWVHNGDTFTVVGRGPTGALTVQRGKPKDEDDGLMVLPDWYVKKHVALAYATTAHRAQGTTVDTAHAVVTTALSREVLYVAMTRGRDTNRAYVALDDPNEDPDDALHTERPDTGYAVLEAVLSHSAAERSATHTGIAAHQAANSMATLIPIYELIAQQLSDDRWDPTIRNLTGDNTGEHIRQSDEWPKLIAILRNVTLTGLDPDQLLSNSWANGPEADQDPAAFLLGRVASAFNTNAGNAQPVRYLAGLVVPGEPATHPDHQRALDRAGASITQRANYLIHQARTDGAPWIETLGTQPGDPQGALTWVTAAQAVATYRDRWGITDDTPLGNCIGPDRTQHRDRSRASRAIDALTKTWPEPTPEAVPDSNAAPSVAPTR